MIRYVVVREAGEGDSRRCGEMGKEEGAVVEVAGTSGSAIEAPQKPQEATLAFTRVGVGQQKSHSHLKQTLR